MRLLRARGGAGVPALAPWLLAFAVMAQGLPSAAQTPETVPAKPPAKSRSVSTKPEWADLTPDQQAALKPLAAAWSGISEGQKRKWIALSRNYPSMAPSEQTKLHVRMSDWTSLSAAQRAQARLNFAQTKGLSTEEKTARWEAYQALSPEQKKKLAADSRSKGAGVAPAVTPVPSNKLADVPVTRSDAAAPVAHAASAPRSARTAAVLPKNAASAAASTASP